MNGATGITFTDVVTAKATAAKVINLIISFLPYFAGPEPYKKTGRTLIHTARPVERRTGV